MTLKVYIIPPENKNIFVFYNLDLTHKYVEYIKYVVMTKGISLLNMS